MGLIAELLPPETLDERYHFFKTRPANVFQCPPDCHMWTTWGINDIKQMCWNCGHKRVVPLPEHHPRAGGEQGKRVGEGWWDGRWVSQVMGDINAGRSFWFLSSWPQQQPGFVVCLVRCIVQQQLHHLGGILVYELAISN
ncbi:hypothetical protein BJ508DRAFT_306422 [Ascobolus immersus RN42]|uniref:Uncharacterized protein n=1 Tax=Ascobolus immersus RN42 TaxID=1160509 RepID=A0A3N4I680_ASCIM|nr:hypothetical protein BJ508DRAFT_306422 [Ascobolus immersus RN42]